LAIQIETQTRIDLGTINIRLVFENTTAPIEPWENISLTIINQGHNLNKLIPRMSGVAIFWRVVPSGLALIGIPMPCPHGNEGSCGICVNSSSASSAPQAALAISPAAPAAAARIGAPAAVGASSSPASASVVSAPCITVQSGHPGKGPAEFWFDKWSLIAKLIAEKQKPLVLSVLKSLEKTGFNAATEQELQAMVMHMTVEMLRPRKDGENVLIGIPYRDDQMKEAIINDVNLVKNGTFCDVTVLISKRDPDAREIYDHLKEKGVRPTIVDPTNQRLAKKVDALYISGGPYDHPNVDKKTRRVPEAREKAVGIRHILETGLIQTAINENLPVLGICGGSWRLAATIGGSIESLSKEKAKLHTGSMVTATRSVAHSVTVQPLTMLHEILNVDNDGLVGAAARPSPGNVLDVNSVHWAHSVIPIACQLMLRPEERIPTWAQVNAVSDGVNEGFELDRKISPFVMGIQWHPEYAMDGLIKNDGTTDVVNTEKHKRIMRAFAHAAKERCAGRLLAEAESARHSGPSSAAASSPSSAQAGPPSIRRAKK
jgi:gamma-glutamyl-gamma-aminobutyrate hydrolase PuuD